MVELIKRDVQDKIEKWLGSREIIAIRGPRQSGKTTLLRQIIQTLAKKIDKKRIHFINLEDDFEKEKFEREPKKYLDYYIEDDKGKHFFLFDEMQYVKNAGKLLKLVYDDILNIKIIITGSSSLDINEIGSYLVGRVLFFELYPFSFEEFLRTKNMRDYSYYKKNRFKIASGSIPDTLFLERLNSYLREYISYGGYPRVVLERSIEKKKFLLKNIFITYIEKDIVKVYGIKYKQRISDLIRYLASLNASIINYNEICGVISLYYKELKEIMRIVEDTYIIRLVRPFHMNLVSEIRKNPKLYFVDTGLRNFIAGRFEFSDEEFGKLLENYVLNNFREAAVNYWRTTAKAEVDFILAEKMMPIEVKVNSKITRSLRSFISQYKPKTAIIVNLNSSYKTKIDNTSILIIPASFI